MIEVNDRIEVVWREGMTVARLLEACRYTAPKIAVFVEGELVRREAYESYLIEDGAKVKVLHLIGGG
jgi:thiamine biosynthesis protein ThiS